MQNSVLQGGSPSFLPSSSGSTVDVDIRLADVVDQLGFKLVPKDSKCGNCEKLKNDVASLELQILELKKETSGTVRQQPKRPLVGPTAKNIADYVFASDTESETSDNERTVGGVKGKQVIEGAPGLRVEMTADLDVFDYTFVSPLEQVNAGDEQTAVRDLPQTQVTCDGLNLEELLGVEVPKESTVEFDIYDYTFVGNLEQVSRGNEQKTGSDLPQEQVSSGGINLEEALGNAMIQEASGGGGNHGQKNAGALRKRCQGRKRMVVLLRNLRRSTRKRKPNPKYADGVKESKRSKFIPSKKNKKKRSRPSAVSERVSDLVDLDCIKN